MLVYCRVIPSIKFAGIHLYTWVETSTVRLKCLAQEHDTMSPGWARNRTTRSGDECNHEAIEPLTMIVHFYYREKLEMSQHELMI